MHKSIHLMMSHDVFLIFAARLRLPKDEWLGVEKQPSTFSSTIELNSNNVKKLFKIYSKIILWQRYAAWLRACQPCIHNQWSVS